MAQRRAVIRRVEGIKEIGYDCTILAALRDHMNHRYSDDTLLRMYLVTGEQRRGIPEIGSDPVEHYLNTVMKIFIDDDDTGVSVEFI